MANQSDLRGSSGSKAIVSYLHQACRDRKLIRQSDAQNRAILTDTVLRVKLMNTVIRIRWSDTKNRMDSQMQPIIRSSQSLGTALRNARRDAGLTQRELGSRTNLRQATISSLEKGEGGTLDTLFAVLTYLKLELQVAERSQSTPALDDIF
jgi:HTH-type transcriptional regulator/antitoxin HipB